MSESDDEDQAGEGGRAGAATTTVKVPPIERFGRLFKWKAWAPTRQMMVAYFKSESEANRYASEVSGRKITEHEADDIARECNGVSLILVILAPGGFSIWMRLDTEKYLVFKGSVPIGPEHPELDAARTAIRRALAKEREQSTEAIPPDVPSDHTPEIEPQR